MLTVGITGNNGSVKITIVRKVVEVISIIKNKS